MSSVQDFCYKHSDVLFSMGCIVPGVLAGKATAAMSLPCALSLMIHKEWSKSSSSYEKTLIGRCAVIVASTMIYKVCMHMFFPDSSYNPSWRQSTFFLFLEGIFCGIYPSLTKTTALPPNNPPGNNPSAATIFKQNVDKIIETTKNEVTNSVVDEALSMFSLPRDCPIKMTVMEYMMNKNLSSKQQLLREIICLTKTSEQCQSLRPFLGTAHNQPHILTEQEPIVLDKEIDPQELEEKIKLWEMNSRISGRKQMIELANELCYCQKGTPYEDGCNQLYRILKNPSNEKETINSAKGLYEKIQEIDEEISQKNIVETKNISLCIDYLREKAQQLFTTHEEIKRCTLDYTNSFIKQEKDHFDALLQEAVQPCDDRWKNKWESCMRFANDEKSAEQTSEKPIQNDALLNRIKKILNN